MTPLDKQRIALYDPQGPHQGSFITFGFVPGGTSNSRQAEVKPGRLFGGENSLVARQRQWLASIVARWPSTMKTFRNWMSEILETANIATELTNYYTRSTKTTLLAR